MRTPWRPCGRTRARTSPGKSSSPWPRRQAGALPRRRRGWGAESEGLEPPGLRSPSTRRARRAARRHTRGRGRRRGCDRSSASLRRAATDPIVQGRTHRVQAGAGGGCVLARPAELITALRRGEGARGFGARRSASRCFRGDRDVGRCGRGARGRSRPGDTRRPRCAAGGDRLGPRARLLHLTPAARPGAAALRGSRGRAPVRSPARGGQCSSARPKRFRNIRGDLRNRCPA